VPRPVPAAAHPDPAAIAQLAGWIAQAERPLVITAGPGTDGSGHHRHDRVKRAAHPGQCPDHRWARRGRARGRPVAATIRWGHGRSALSQALTTTTRSGREAHNPALSVIGSARRYTRDTSSRHHEIRPERLVGDAVETIRVGAGAAGFATVESRDCVYLSAIQLRVRAVCCRMHAVRHLAWVSRC